MARTPAVTYYAPLGAAVVDPDAVIFAGRPGRLMRLQEASARAEDLKKAKAELVRINGVWYRVDQEFRFTKAKIEGGLVLFIHDEIGAEVVTHQAEQARALLTQAMTEAFALVFPDAPLNSIVASAIGPSWGAAKP